MNRKEFLQKLLHKAESGHDYVRTHLYQTSESLSPPATIKRMQILQMGMGKIQLPQAKTTEPIFDKQTNANNRRVLVLQKVKSLAGCKERTPQHKSLRNTCLPQALDNLTEPDKSLLSGHTAKTQNSEKGCSESQSESEKLLGSSSALVNRKCQNESIRKIGEYKKSLLRSSEYPPEPNSGPIRKGFVDRRSNAVPVVQFSKNNLSRMKQNQKDQRLEMRKEVRKNYSKVFLPTPKITAQSYIVVQEISNQLKIHLSVNSKSRAEVASLTKIMTCVVALEIAKRLSIDMGKEEVRIGKFQSSVGGTSAKLNPDESYTLESLLYGLMLPSGNDASLAIAVWGGKMLMSEDNKGSLSCRKRLKKEYCQRFIQEMNKKANSIGMTKTTYANPHGLVNSLNRSCAHDVAVLCHHAMKIDKFRQVVSTKHYRTRVKVYEVVTTWKKIDRGLEEDSDYEDGESICEEISEYVLKGERVSQWENSHKLLHSSSDYIGIKTGVTTAAGPCLSSCVVSPCGRTFYIVVLSCKKMLLRFKETDLLKKWIFKQEGIKKSGRFEAPASETASRVSEEQDLWRLDPEQD